MRVEEGRTSLSHFLRARVALSSCCDKMPQQLKKGRMSLGPQFKKVPITLGKAGRSSRQQERASGTVHISVDWEAGGEWRECWSTAGSLLFSFHPVWDSSPSDGTTHTERGEGVSLPSSVISVRKHLPGHNQMPAPLRS